MNKHLVKRRLALAAALVAKMPARYGLVIDSLPLFSDGMSVSGHVGHQMLDDNALAGIPDYTFYDLGVTFAAGAFALDVRYVSTDMDEADCYGGLTWCEGSVVVSGSLSFGD